jgi:signal transduction histidine kinase
MPPIIEIATPEVVGSAALRASTRDVRLEADPAVVLRADPPGRRVRYGRAMNWFERRWAWVRSLDVVVVDAVLAVVFAVIGAMTVFSQDIRDDAGALTEGYREPSAWALLTIVAVCAPIAVRRRQPIVAIAASGLAIFVHIAIGWPEGALPLSVLLITYAVGSTCPPRQAVVGLIVVVAAIVALSVTDSPGLDAVGALGTIGQFAAIWAIGVALRNRRLATEARISEADERAEAARQTAARVLAEERLRIAQELHDVVAHSMSVIAVQAGAGMHVIDEQPDKARAALEAISATSRATLTEMRRLLGVLRGDDGARAHAPAPGLADLPHLVDDVRGAGVPVALHVEGAPAHVHPGVELSAYRVVQEALTNVIKHAGATTAVDVTVRHLPGSLAIEVVDDGRGLAANGASPPGERDGDGHGLVGMRERVELWGGDLSVGPAPGGGYRVRAQLPYGEPG